MVSSYARRTSEAARTCEIVMRNIENVRRSHPYGTQVPKEALPDRIELERGIYLLVEGPINGTKPRPWPEMKNELVAELVSLRDGMPRGSKGQKRQRGRINKALNEGLKLEHVLAVVKKMEDGGRKQKIEALCEEGRVRIEWYAEEVQASLGPF